MLDIFKNFFQKYSKRNVKLVEHEVIQNKSYFQCVMQRCLHLSLGTGRWRRYCRTQVNRGRSCTSSIIFDLVAKSFSVLPKLICCALRRGRSSVGYSAELVIVRLLIRCPNLCRNHDPGTCG